jgi:cytochrome c-type biogenesis protein CcmH
MNAALLSLTLFLASGQFAPQQAGSEPLAPPLEMRVQKLGKELRCAVCQGLSVADSPSSMARAQLDKIRELVAQGKSDQEVYDYFVARYGEWVLLQPKVENNLIVWLGPVALLLGGAFVIFRQVKRGEAPAAPVASTPAAPPATHDAVDPYLQAVRRELDQ